MNRLPGHVIDGGLVKVLDTVVPVRSDAGNRDEVPDGDVDVLVRPEGLTIEARGEVPGGSSPRGQALRPAVTAS
ncbi:MAG TPA: hypothetical protein VN695_12640 [Streptosporangiaceae bacterium]|nr:hypothetical protein [Streptosporangiaceae bacterium]